ncbi:MAG: LysE family transporter [Bacteroidia bacterium]|nr:LysE family transporter [Bacteroidia bacterium]
MLEPVISGITFGLLLAVMLGPVFFALIQTSLHEGFRAGVHLAIGVFLSDTILIAACFFFAAQLNLMEEHKTIVGWVGGLLLIGFGAFNFFRKIKVREVDDNKKTIHAKFMAEGFLLNFFNPAVLFFWLGVVGIVSLRENYSRMHELFFFSSVLLTVFSTDLLKSFVAHRIKNVLNAKVILWVNRITGLVLAAFGMHMIYKVF